MIGRGYCLRCISIRICFCNLLSQLGTRLEWDAKFYDLDVGEGAKMYYCHLCYYDVLCFLNIHLCIVVCAMATGIFRGCTTPAFSDTYLDVATVATRKDNAYFKAMTNC